jgi:hypothetical protein
MQIKWCYIYIYIYIYINTHTHTQIKTFAFFNVTSYSEFSLECLLDLCSLKTVSFCEVQYHKSLKVCLLGQSHGMSLSFTYLFTVILHHILMNRNIHGKIPEFISDTSSP